MIRSLDESCRMRQLLRTILFALLLSWISFTVSAEPPGSPRGNRDYERGFDQEAAEHGMRTPLLAGLMVLVLGTGSLLLFKLVAGRARKDRKK